jgi:lipoyl synthase
MVTVYDSSSASSQRRNPRTEGPRHPEKAWRPPSARREKPDWLRVRAPDPTLFNKTQSILRQLNLVTVCQEAACPNIGECWQKNHATFMILGDICTRGCAFCNVATGKPGPISADEPSRIAAAAAALRLTHVVVTSVNRDDLPDGGAQHFAAVIRELRSNSAASSIEVLTPDFRNKQAALETVLEAGPDVFNHNIETVPELYRTIRPGARYDHSLNVLAAARQLKPNLATKSGLMVGLGETRDQVVSLMTDLRSAGVDILTIGQYLQPTLQHAEVKRFVPPDEFNDLKRIALDKGFAIVSSSPLTRSSHHAEHDFAKLMQKRGCIEPAQQIQTE